MKRALLIAPMSSVHERFNIANIEALKELKFEIHLAANFSSDEHAKEYKEFCEENGFVVYDIPFVRHSLMGNLKCISKVKELFRSGNFDIIHCHTETGGLITRLCKNANKKSKYIYTPHGMSFYKGSSWKSQLIYRPLEKFICLKMDINIAINNEEYETLQKWNKDIVKYIHGAGFDFDSINNVEVEINKKKQELGIPIDRPLLLSVGELDNNKNHKVIIEAISKIENENRPYLLICGEGNNKEKLIELAKTYNYEKSLYLPGYRYDMPEIFPIADIFVFPSFHEGLSFALMQAMAAKLPVVCSRIRGNVDLIDSKGGFLHNPTDVDAIYRSIKELIINFDKCTDLGNYNYQKIQMYSFDMVKKELVEIYSFY